MSTFCDRCNSDKNTALASEGCGYSRLPAQELLDKFGWAWVDGKFVCVVCRLKEAEAQDYCEVMEFVNVETGKSSGRCGKKPIVGRRWTQDDGYVNVCEFHSSFGSDPNG